MTAEGGGIVGVVLAGGRARRMGGGDKGLLELAGRPLLAHVVGRAQPQVGRLVLNANGDPARFAAFALPVVADAVPGFAGPLAGVLAGMAWARRHVPGGRWLASFAADTPFFPPDMVARLVAAIDREGATIATVASAGRRHPVFALWPRALEDDLRRAVEIEAVRKIEAWTQRYPVAVVPFDEDGGDPFFNINEPADLAAAAARSRDRSVGDNP
jgi:molybdopterin-guanine dinucleotide biosynthesis protein A